MFTIVFLVCLLVHCYTDLRWQLLYDEVNLFLGFMGLAYACLAGKLLEALAGAGLGCGLLLLIYWLSRGGLGLGDVKLALSLGMWLGAEGTLLALLIAFLSGGLVGLLLLAAGLKGRQDAIPFGPYIALGGWLSFFWGGEIITWYFGCW